MSKMNSKYFILYLTLFMSSFFVYAQQEQKIASKEHYIIHQNGAPIDFDKLTNYLNSGQFNLDEYRLYNTRRIISFSGTTATIELYSANELLDLYQKPIAPNTPSERAIVKPVSFEIYEGTKGIKPLYN